MTNLTEQWKKGELPFGAYYVNRLEEQRIWLYNDRSKTHIFEHEIYEILAPVPSYEEWKKMKEQRDACTWALDKIGDVLVKHNLVKK